MPSMRYNADIAPDPHAWLETDEADRLIAIEAFHARVRDRFPSPRLHALIHLVVENQLVMPDQEDVRETFACEGSLLVIPIVAGEVDPAWPPQRLSTEKGEELLANMAAGFARAYRHFAPLRQAAADAGHGRATYRRSAAKVGRNDPCPCGSGKKFKHCCGLSA